jgi:hypothetical protein
MYAFGILIQLISGLAFAYFLYNLYIVGITSEFISISAGSGYTCSTVPKFVSGLYIADSNGTWQGRPFYDYSQGLYVLTLTEAAVHPDEYSMLMSYIEKAVIQLSEASVNFPLTLNLLVYMSWQFACDSGSPLCSKWIGQSFAFSANSQYMLSLSYVDLTISNEAADCDSYSVSSYDLANAVNDGSYDYADFVMNPTCNSTVIPESLGYSSYLSGTSFTVTVDVRSLIDSTSINFGILQLSSLSLVSYSPTLRFAYNGATYLGAYYVDSWYVGMRPIYCVSAEDGTIDGRNGVVSQLCFMLVGDLIGFPIFNHYGAGIDVDGITRPIPCTW